MRLFTLALALFLSGCWAGEGLYSASDSTQPIAAGLYRATDGDKRVQIEKVTLLPSGLTEIGDGDGKDLYGFVPLDSSNRRYVVWFRKDEETPDDRSQLYMLLERRSADEFIFYIPICDGKLAQIAVGAGASVIKGMGHTCQFPTRASLEAAMRRVEISGESMRFVRIRDK